MQVGGFELFKNIQKLSRAFSRKLTHDATTAYSSDTTLFMIVSFFPFLMFLLTLLQYLPFTKQDLMAVIENAMPDQVAAMIGNLVNELYSTSSLLLSVTLITTLWTASRGMLGIYRGLNSVYGIEETRNYIVLRLLAMLYTFIFVIMLFMLLGLYVFGNQIVAWLTGYFPALMMNKYAILVVSFRTTIGIVILLLFFILMYCFIPNRRTKFFKELPGAAFAAVGWVVFSYLYSFYIDNMGNMKATYGSLTAVVLCVLWLYFCMSIFFLGAEINSILAIPSVHSAISDFFRHKKTEKTERN